MDTDTRALTRTLTDHMEAEAAIFAGLGLEMTRLREVFQAKHWTPALQIAAEIERSAVRVEAADNARDEAFVRLRDHLGLPHETAFSAVLPSLPPEERRELEDSWRRLRLAVVRLRTATGRMRYSSEALADALNRILEGIFPYRRGKIYSRHGTANAVSGALLVDQRR